LILAQNGWTAFSYACGSGHGDIVTLLLACGANINIQNHVSVFIVCIKALGTDAPTERKPLTLYTLKNVMTDIISFVTSAVLGRSLMS